jgi:hypothetical protein
MRACVDMHTMADPDGELLTALDKGLPERAVGMTAAAVAESSGSLAHLTGRRHTRLGFEA